MKARDVAGTEDTAAASRMLVNNRHALILIPLLALFIVHPLIVHGCSCGHDFDFHLVSWFEAAMQISHGTLLPHWAYTPAWNAGEPRFIFYPPGSWYLGASLGLALTHLPGVSEASAWTAVPILFTWITLTLSGTTMYRLARIFTGPNAAMLAATIYMANPYMLFTAYERTAYGELLAAAWIPLLFDGILRERVSAVRIAVPIALLWLTNVPAAVMGCYALPLLAAMRIICETRHSNTVRNAARCLAGTALGFGVAAFYIVPAAYERRYVQSTMAMIGGMRIDANFLFTHTGSSPDDLLHDQVLRTASWIAVLLLATTAIALIIVLSRKCSAGTSGRLRILPLITLTIIIAVMLTPLGAPVWRHAPEMAFLQFPWRLLALVAPVLALAIAVALPASFDAVKTSLPTKTSAPAFRRSALTALGIAATLALPAWYLFHQACDPEDTAAARLALFHSNEGTDPTDEYTPITADNDALQSGHPSWWLADSSDAAPPVQAPTNAARTASIHLAIDASHAAYVILNLRNYPAWRITMAHDGATAQTVTERGSRIDGLISIPIPAGLSAIDVRYSQTADQTAGDAISLSSLAMLTLLLARSRRFSPSAMQPA